MIQFPQEFNARQTTKADLINICWALGVCSTEFVDVSVEDLRKEIKQKLPNACLGDSRMPEKTDLVGVAHALGCDHNLATEISKLRSCIQHAIVRKLPNSKLARAIGGR